MSSLEELARGLGGVVHTTPQADWLETSIGELRAVVIVRASCHELGVFTPSSRELDPLHVSAAEWIPAARDSSIPRLHDGYIFTGCRGGIVFARSADAPTLSGVVSALWQLARLAQTRWWPPQLPSREQRARMQRAARRHALRERARDALPSLAFAGAFALVVRLLRRS